MGKTIRFNENGLIAIKKKLNEIMVGTDCVSHNDVYVNEEVGEEFAPVASIGGEEKNGDVIAGGNKFHMEQVEESINFSDNGMSINDENFLSKYNLKDLVLSKNGNYVTLNKIVANELGKGNGGRFMDYLTQIADKNGWILALTPDDSFGASSVGRLKNFYKRYGFVPNKGRNTDFSTREAMIRKPLTENVEKEVESSEVDLSSFKKRDTLPPGIWKDEETLDSRVRLKLLDIADDFWEFVNLTWVEPKGIIITGSICNFNWSKFSDIDLHLIVDFKEIDEKTEFVRQYVDSKKNEWNNEHEGLKIKGFPVELYVQDVNENPEAGGIYDLEENKWVRRPNPHTIKSIGLNKFNIKDKAAEIMTIIDDMYQALDTTTDGHAVEQIGDDASYLWKKVKNLRKKSLDKNGESGAGNIVYKVLRRTGYLDKLWKLSTRVYDRSNSINEGVNYDTFCTNQSLRYKAIYKMVEDGYIFHGADDEWDEFDSNKVKGGSRGIYGYGAYFTNAAYKCEEYGNRFMILDSHGFNFLNIDEKVHENNNIFYEKLREFDILQDRLDNCRNVREYDYYSELLDKYKLTINRRLLEQFVSLIDSSTGDITYRTLNANVGGYEDVKKEVSELYLALGYDGFVCDNQFVVFNFEKLNQNIVKNKEELISKYIVTESVKKYLTVLKEEVAVDGSTEHNPYEKRWKAERDALKNFVANYGKLMQSKEDNKGGKLYKVYYDETMSNLIGYNYCICVQWNEQEMKPGSTVYIRALDKFTPFIRRNLQYDNRGRDNMRGTYDDTGYSQRIESKKKDSIIEGIDELNLYHSSYSNFNKFNHKKYMSSGAGSQTFGWGTYLTDSYPIAVDYAKKFIYYKFNEFVVAAEPEQYIYNAESYDQEIITEAVKLYKSVVRTRMCFTWGLDNKYNRNFFDSFFETDDEDPGNRYDSVLEEYNRYKEIFKKYFSELAERVGEEEAENRIKNAFEVSNDKYGYIMKQTKDDYVSEQNHRNTVNNLVKTIINNIWDAADANVKKESYIYEVEIPDDNGINYIDYNNQLPHEALRAIENGITSICRRFGLDLWQAMKKWEELLEYRRNQPRGQEVYDTIRKIIGLHASKGKAEKAASLFLMQCGFDGIKYKAGSIYGLPEGAADNSLNYVIFDSNKIRIASKNLFTEAF